MEASLLFPLASPDCLGGRVFSPNCFATEAKFYSLKSALPKSTDGLNYPFVYFLPDSLLSNFLLQFFSVITLSAMLTFHKTYNQNTFRITPSFGVIFFYLHCFCFAFFRFSYFSTILDLPFSFRHKICLFFFCIFNKLVCAKCRFLKMLIDFYMFRIYNIRVNKEEKLYVYASHL